MLLRPLVAALRRPVPSSRVFRSVSTLQVSPLNPTTTATAAASLASYPETSHQLTVLEHAILRRRPSLALHHLVQLQSPPSYHLLQKLCVLLARQQKNRSHALRAFEILCGVYRTPGFKPDDYSNLASVYVMDACVRFQMLDAAIELYDEVVNQGVMLDLPAYNGLLTALIEAERLEEAIEILKELINRRDVCPTEQTVLPVLVELIKHREYESAMEIMKKGQNRGVEFSSDTFYPLLSLTEKDTASTDALVKFLTFIEDVWDEYKAFVDYDSEEEDDVGDS